MTEAAELSRRVEDPQQLRAEAARALRLCGWLDALARDLGHDAGADMGSWSGPAESALRSASAADAVLLGHVATALQVAARELRAYAVVLDEELMSRWRDGSDPREVLRLHGARSARSIDAAVDVLRPPPTSTQALPSPRRPGNDVDVDSGRIPSRANELRLVREIAVLLALVELDEAQRRRLEVCLRVRTELGRIRSRTDPGTGEPLAAQLVVFDPYAFGGQGRAALAVGDVDIADNVAFLVPGMGADVRRGLARLTTNALRVGARARRADPMRTTAVVAWMGYDAPELAWVAADDAATTGAALLATDLRAVGAVRAEPPHLTLVGHSYGSTTVGTALRDHRTAVGDAVLLGSPGANVERARDLRLPAGHVFVGASSRDPVSYLDRFGADPAHEAFGAVRFRAEDPSRNGWRLDLADHSKYFRARSESLDAIARVVVGDDAGVRRAPYRDEMPLLPDGISTDPEADREPTTVN